MTLIRPGQVDATGETDGHVLTVESGVAKWKEATGGAMYRSRTPLAGEEDDDLITLAATPIADTIDIFMDGLLVSPDDYTVDGLEVTLDTPIGYGGATVVVTYWTETENPGESTIGTAAISIVDTFDRANNATSLGTTSDGNATWTANAGTWGIFSNQAYCPSADAGDHATVDGGASDGVVAATIASKRNNTGLVFRWQDASNFLCALVSHNNNQIALFSCVAGSYSQLAISSPSTYVNGQVLSVELDGSDITVKADGSTILTHNTSTFQTATGYGLHAWTGTSSTLWDDFSFTSA